MSRSPARATTETWGTSAHKDSDRSPTARWYKRRRSRIRSTLGMIAVIAMTASFLTSAGAQVVPVPVTVNSTADGADINLGDGFCNTAVPGECTLDAAIQEANASAVNRIEFNIATSDPGHNAGVWTISPTTALTDIDSTIEIDARTQPGYVGAPVIELDGTNAGPVQGLTFRVPSVGSSLHGLSVVNYEGLGIFIIGKDIEIAENYAGLRSDGVTRGPNQNGVVLANGAENVVVRDNVLSGNSGSGLVLTGGAVRNFIDGNLIGTTADGTAAPGSGPAGISLAGASENVIGGISPNVISGNAGDGIVIRGGNLNTIENNVIGLSITGAKLQNGWSGIQLLDNASNTRIEGNTIAGNGRRGIGVTNVVTTIIRRNFIGTDSMATPGLGNRWEGIHIETQLFPVDVFDNSIAYNGLVGIAVESDTTGAVSIDENMFFENGGLAIDLNHDGVTFNDAGDADTGANDLLNYPEIVATTPQAPGNFTAQYVLSAPPGRYMARIYKNPSFPGDPSGFGEGEQLAAADVVNHPGGVATYITTQSFSAADGDVITAHLQETGDGQASEFGPQFVVTSVPNTPTVNSTDDDPDINPGDGLCNTGQLNSEGRVECTLRAAIQEANADPDSTAIDFDIPIADSGRRTFGADDVLSLIHI